MYWGFHYVGNIFKCCPISIRSPTIISAFTQKLVRDIDMVAYGQPQIVHFGSDDKAGYTLQQLIETSNITAHFTEYDNSFYIDVFSCKKFDANTVDNCIRKYFNPEQVNSIMIKRRADQLPELQ